MHSLWYSLDPTVESVVTRHLTTLPVPLSTGDLCIPIPVSVPILLSFHYRSGDGLARPEVDRLGFLDKRRSVWRVLKDEETTAYGGSERRQLFGCRQTLPVRCARMDEQQQYPCLRLLNLVLSHVPFAHMACAPVHACRGDSQRAPHARFLGNASPLGRQSIFFVLDVVHT
jgi:hypothetical protein